MMSEGFRVQVRRQVVDLDLLYSNLFPSFGVYRSFIWTVPFKYLTKVHSESLADDNLCKARVFGGWATRRSHSAKMCKSRSSFEHRMVFQSYVYYKFDSFNLYLDQGCH